MPTDLTEILENVPAPPMHLDPETVLARGRRRRRRRRLGGAAAVAGAAALVIPVAGALHTSSPPTVPAISGPADCLFPDQGYIPWFRHTEGAAQLAGTPWLDSGLPTGDRSVRVQVNTDTCDGLAVAVSNGSEGGVTTVDLTGQPSDAFWVYAAFGGGLDKRGNELPVDEVAVALLPPGQRVCGITSTATTPSDGQTPTLSAQSTTPAGQQWQASVGTITGIDHAQNTAALKICDGTRVIAPALRPLNVIPTPEATPNG